MKTMLKNNLKNETLDAMLTLALQTIEKEGRHRAQMHLDRIDNLTLLTVTIGKRSSTMFFVDNIRAYTYWFDREERKPLIKLCYYEGMTQRRTAEFLQVSQSVISKDLRAMRLNNELDPDKRIARDDIKPTLKLQSHVPAAKSTQQQQNIRSFAFAGLNS